MWSKTRTMNTTKTVIAALLLVAGLPVHSAAADDVTARHGVSTGQAVKGVELSPRTQALRAYCQVLLCGNEFMYIE